MQKAHPQERLIFEVFPDLPGVEFLRRDYVTQSYDAHSHEGFAIGTIIKGSERFWCRGAEHVAPPRSVVAINPREVHRGGPGPTGWWTYQMLYVEAESLLSIQDESMRSRGAPWFPTPLIDDGELAGALAALQTTLHEADSSLERQTCLLQVLTALVCRHAACAPRICEIAHEPRAVAAVKCHLEEHHGRECTLHELSALTRVSPFHLLRTFNRFVGIPPHAYLRHIRIARAKDLLERGMPLVDVAATTGFADQSHLTRQFKRIVGVTPAAYARAIRFKTAAPAGVIVY